jgi:hypothetical protein
MPPRKIDPVTEEGLGAASPGEVAADDGVAAEARAVVVSVVGVAVDSTYTCG